MTRKNSDGFRSTGSRAAEKSEGPREAKVISLDQYRWRKAGLNLRQKLGEFAADPLFANEVTRAQELYLTGLDPDLIDENDEIIMERCFEWFIFDYVLEGGETLIDIFSAVSEITDIERSLLREWSSSRLSVFEVTGVASEKGLKLRDLILNRKITVSNYSVTGNLDRGSVVFMRVLRVGGEFEFSTGGLALPPAFGKPLIRRIKSDMARYAARKGREGYTPEVYLKDRAHKINSWMMGFAVKTTDPTGEDSISEASMSSLIAQRITDTFLDDYYEKWINKPAQALGGKTPRESCLTVHGRARVEELLKELEKIEKKRSKKGEPNYDINKVRARLGLIPGENAGKAAPDRNLPAGGRKEVENLHWLNRSQAGVAALIRQLLEKKEYTQEQVEGAIKLWHDYCSRENPTVKKEVLWLAAVVYTLARLEFNTAVQQQKLAGEYGISPSSLSGKYRSICKALDLVVFDRRYTSVKSPLEDLETSDPLLAKIIYKLKL